MYAEERRRHIAELAREHGRVEVAALAETLAVTPETVRRDLTDLERRGILRRVHGGAIPAEHALGEAPLAERASAMAAEKRRIAKAALEHVPSSGTVLLDAGTSTGELATLFPDRDLTVITNALPIATALAARSSVTVHLLGGRIRGRTLASVDGWAVRALADLRVDVAFVATNGVTVPRGLSTPDPAEAEVKTAMVAAARRAVLLADHTKYGADHLVRFAELGDLDLVITDTGLDAAEAEAIAAAGPEVIRA